MPRTYETLRAAETHRAEPRFVWRHSSISGRVEGLHPGWPEAGRRRGLLVGRLPGLERLVGGLWFLGELFRCSDVSVRVEGADRRGSSGW
jgi:hypothetical protein